MYRAYKRTLNKKEVEAKNAAMNTTMNTADNNTSLVGHTVKVRMTDRKNPLYLWNALYLPMKITTESDVAYSGYVLARWNPKNRRKEQAYVMTIHKNDLLTGKMIMEDMGCLECDSCSRRQNKAGSSSEGQSSEDQNNAGGTCAECICGLNIESKMTFQELKGSVASAKDVPKPKVKELLEKDTPVATYRGLGYWLNVYRNGFVVAGKGNFATVFRLDECGGYSFFTPADMTAEELEEELVKRRLESDGEFDYDMGFCIEDYLEGRTEDEELADYLEMMEILESMEEEHRYSAEFFLDLRWEVRVLMEAEDQLKRNVPLYRVRNDAI